ncbi:MAG: hypothetical protein H6713_31225 [Myxococcales bacterium]|nr:hypothetical protein [Myxococcales bacterium]
MTLPRKHSRLIIVDERRFRWLVRPQGDRVRVAVQLESGAGRAIATGVREGVVVTPARVRTFIEFAIARGWSPEDPRAPPPLAEFEALYAPLAEPVALGDLRAIPVAERVCAIRYPWMTDATETAWGYVELGAGTSANEIAALVASWCARARLPTGEHTATVLAALLGRSPGIPGGLLWRRDDQVLATPGCCCALAGRGEWRTFLDDGRFWGGHDPWVCVTREGAEIRILPEPGAPVIAVDERAYREHLRRAELELEAFAVNLHTWFIGQDPARAAELDAWFRRAIAPDARPPPGISHR